ncbi:protein-arginine deiminase family protein [Paenibacillus tepidiphilus]|uniref:protein-arginine deiminase family protein n=1 Tax=Paenibacillus tepidiphilus TaxID=2608683 RepID=UPI00123BF8A9|nr:protein-arginine deiminase family protein [Paenibacillus tepidiphilus]
MEAILLYNNDGEKSRFYFNKTDGHILLKEQSNVDVFYVQDDQWTLLMPDIPLNNPLPYEGLMSISGKSNGFGYAVLHHVTEGGAISDELRIDFADIPVVLDIDSNRDGDINPQEAGKGNWVWGKNEPGAIVLVNNDRDHSDITPARNEHSEHTPLIVRPTGLQQLPEGIELVLYTQPEAAQRFGVFRINQIGQPECILGRKSKEELISKSVPLDPRGEQLFIEAYEFPGPYFEGLVTLELHLRRTGGIPAAIDTAVFRVAPWIMMPNSLPVAEVYACVIPPSESGENSKFLEGLTDACNQLGVPLRLIPYEDNKGDRWIQDEIEIGYCESPTHSMPVVFDSPRNRELDSFPEQSLFGPDFGHFQIGGSTPNSLDSFGNLEVSPPVVVKGRQYPLGRIIFGGRAYGDYQDSSRQMMPHLRHFLHAQKVQSPIEIFTDWLAVGHVDEIINFVPAENAKGFKILAASPMRAKAVLDRLAQEGHSNAAMFEGLFHELDGQQVSAQITVGELLSDARFWSENRFFQKCMDINRIILKEHLDITDADVIEIPVLFHPRSVADNRTEAYFPDMVNHLVIGNTSLVPKPYGPVIDGVDEFERSFRKALPGRDIRFIDDWYSYHQKSGEIHCGTNVRRKPFEHMKWWEFLPEGGYNI